MARHSGDAWGISAAIFLGSVGAAAGYVASTTVGIAAAVGVMTFVVVYGVRLLVATALTAGTGPDDAAADLGVRPQWSAPRPRSGGAPFLTRPTSLEDPMVSGRPTARPWLPYTVAAFAGLAVIAAAYLVRQPGHRTGPQ